MKKATILFGVFLFLGTFGIQAIHGSRKCRTYTIDGHTTTICSPQVPEAG